MTSVRGCALSLSNIVGTRAVTLFGAAGEIVNCASHESSPEENIHTYFPARLIMASRDSDEILIFLF